MNPITAHDPLTGIALFRALPPAARAAVAAQIAALRVPAGALVVRQGEPAERFYVIAAGNAEVWARKGAAPASPDAPFDPARHTLIATLGPGDSFGEMALLLGGRRQATVRAAADLVLYYLDAATFQAIVGTQDGLQRTLEVLTAVNSANLALKQASPFAALPPEQVRWLASRVTAQTFPAGDPIVRQGEAGDAFYLLRRGEVVVELERPDGVTLTLDTMAPGACFGEQSLLTGEPRSATVRALTPVEMLRLDRADFLRIVQEHPERGRYFVQLGLQRQRPRRHGHWVIERQTGQDGAPVFVLKDTERLRYLRLTEEGAFLWDLMDGLHTIKGLARAYFDRYGTFGLQTILDLTQQLHEAGFVTIQRFEGRAEARSARSRLEAAWLVRYFALPDLEGAISLLYRLVRPLYTRPGQLLLLATALAGAGRFLLYLVQGGVAAPGHRLALWLVVATLVGIGIQVVLHEAAHALTCKRFGREVHTAGIGWYFFLPVAYVDTSDSWLVGRWARIAIAAAGPYANFIISGVATLCVGLSGDAGVRATLFQIALTGNVLGLLNLNPLMELDGYYMLMDWLDIPNLRGKALTFIGAVLWRAPRPHTMPRLRRIYAGYGTLALLYTGFTAWTVATGYHRFLEAGVRLIVPAIVATMVGWACAAVLTWLILQRAWHDLRRGARPA